MKEKSKTGRGSRVLQLWGLFYLSPELTFTPEFSSAVYKINVSVPNSSSNS